ncbi:hypothetical protein BKA70DRAFT_1233565 [Coprinopsis sp. MPI-PUGE-AT-0042]|nr:hypothetical protein BKA70DRAFT_1233565 [Coprinopsis sp. MPI-PUGE-AT-0042]
MAMYAEPFELYSIEQAIHRSVEGVEDQFEKHYIDTQLSTREREYYHSKCWGILAARVIRECHASRALKSFQDSYEWAFPNCERLYDDFVDLWRDWMSMHTLATRPTPTLLEACLRRVIETRKEQVLADAKIRSQEHILEGTIVIRSDMCNEDGDKRNSQDNLDVPSAQDGILSESKQVAYDEPLILLISDSHHLHPLRGIQRTERTPRLVNSRVINPSTTSLSEWGAMAYCLHLIILEIEGRLGCKDEEREGVGESNVTDFVTFLSADDGSFE